jgi:hypothetical protein
MNGRVQIVSTFRHLRIASQVFGVSGIVPQGIFVNVVNTRGLDGKHLAPFAAVHKSCGHGCSSLSFSRF